MSLVFASPLSRFLSLSLLYLALIWVAYRLYRRGYIRRAIYRDLLAVGVLAWLVTAFFHQVVFDIETYVPAGGGDLAMLLYPNYHFAQESFRQGIIPLWNPYLYGGYPFAADIQSGLFYPLNLLFFFLTPDVTYHSLEFLAIGHIFLAGLSMYVMMRFLRSGEPIGCLASLVAATAYMFSDYFIVHLGNLNLIAAAAWLPIVFLGLHRGLAQIRYGLAAMGGLFLGIVLLTGHVQPFLYMVLVALLYLLYRLYQVWADSQGLAMAFKVLGVFGVFVIVAMGTSAIQLIPAYELSLHSIRPDLPYSESIEYSLPPSQLISLLIPDFFGRGPEAYWGPWDRVETGYLGVLPLVLAFVALSLRRERIAGFMALLAVVALLVSFGGYSIVQGWLYASFPGFDAIRAHARMVFVFSFAVSVLAGLGVQALSEPLENRWNQTLGHFNRRVFVIMLMVGAVAILAAYLLVNNAGEASPAITQRLSDITAGVVAFFVFLGGGLALIWTRYRSIIGPGIFGVLAVAWVASDLIFSGSGIDVGAGEPIRNFDHPEVIEFFEQDTELYRVDTITNVWDVWQPNATLLYGLYDVMGGYNPLLLSDTERYWATLGSRSAPLYDLLNAKYIIGHKNVPLDWDKWVLAFDGDPQVNVYRNINVMPRALLVGRAKFFAEREALFSAMHEPDFDPAREVYLEQESGEIEEDKETGSGTVEVISFSPNSIELETQSDGSAYLVLSESYYPGWRATVDDRPVEVLRANYRFRAVPVDQGRHTVRLSFEPDSWRLGAAISGLTWIGLVGWKAWSLVRRRKRYLAKA